MRGIVLCREGFLWEIGRVRRPTPTVLWRVSLVFTPRSLGVHARLKGAEPPLAFFVFFPLKGLFWDAIEVMALVTGGRSVAGCYEVFLER